MQIKAKLWGTVLCSLAAAACGSEDDGGTGGTGGVQTSTVTGVIAVDTGDVPVPVEGATVAVFGTSISATSNASGEFTLQNVPNGDVFFVTSAPGHWGSVDYYEVPGETDGGVFLAVVTDDEVASFAEALGRTLQASDGAVNITYEGAGGGETGTISASSDPPATFNLAGVPIQQDTVIADEEGSADLVFSSVDPGDGPITATVTGAPGATNCEIDQP
ncbi:MAG: hypothetical protein WCE62_20575, partial [Polyangiales bacterium]